MATRFEMRYDFYILALLLRLMTVMICYSSLLIFV